MDFAVLEPSVISISEDDWSCEESRDNYLEHFNSILNHINENKKIFLAWCEKTEELIWSAPQSPPWRMDRDWSNAIIPIIYERIQKNVSYIDVSDDIDPCSVVPCINCDRDDLYFVFLQTLTTLHCNCNKIMIAFGLNNIPPEVHAFKVADNNLNPIPIFLTCESDFLNQIDVACEYWPSNPDDSNSIEKAVSIILKRDYGLTIPPINYQFSRNFIRKLIVTTNDRIKILNAIAKRLSMSTANAGRDGCLQDEILKGKDGVRRFRVTPRPSSKRIHYTFSSSGIDFLMFYDSGEHDEGL